MTKVISEGRIVLWEGASLWAFNVSPQSDTPPNKMHSHHAFQLTLSAGGTANIRTADALFEDPVILIAPDVPHAIEPQGRIALLFADPEGRVGAGLSRLLEGAPIAGLGPIPSLEHQLSCIWDTPAASDADLAHLGRTLLVRLLGTLETEVALDERVSRVLRWLRTNGLADATASKAAKVACLSESRFSHLFVEEVGLPLRTYVLWQRLMKAVELIARGESLTTAAHHAGFADSAHFSRTFYRMFGLPPVVLGLSRPKD